MAGPHHRGEFRRRSKSLRDAANEDPGTRCWRCGQLARPGDPWQAGHIIDADEHSPLAPEHRSCNARAGQAKGRRRNYERTSRPW